MMCMPVLHRQRVLDRRLGPLRLQGRDGCRGPEQHVGDGDEIVDETQEHVHEVSHGSCVVSSGARPRCPASYRI